MLAYKTKGIFKYILVLAIVAHIVLSGAIYQTMDILNFHFNWVKGFMQDGLLSGYENMEFLDYPPLFPTLLYLISPLIVFASQISGHFLFMLSLKLIPLIFNIGIGVVIYSLSRKKDDNFALFAATIWLFNPSAIFNSCVWGQSDCIFVFFILLIFYLLHKKQPIAASVLLGIAALLKLQALYLAPLVLCEIIFYYPIKTTIKSFLSGACVYILGWTPFVIVSNELLLPLRITLGGLYKYNYLSINAANFYQLTQYGVNAKFELIYNNFYINLSKIFLVVIILGLITTYLYTKLRNKKIDTLFLGFIFYNSIFMLTTKMHERYQFPVLAFLILSYALNKNRVILILYIITLSITFLNQFLVLYPVSFLNLDAQHLLLILSILNGIFYIYTICIFVKSILDKGDNIRQT